MFYFLLFLSFPIPCRQRQKVFHFIHFFIVAGMQYKHTWLALWSIRSQHVQFFLTRVHFWSSSDCPSYILIIVCHSHWIPCVLTSFIHCDQTFVFPFFFEPVLGLMLPKSAVCLSWLFANLIYNSLKFDYNQLFGWKWRKRTLQTLVSTMIHGWLLLFHEFFVRP